MPSAFRNVDPRALRVPSSRPTGADPVKLQRQIVQFGASSTGMIEPTRQEILARLAQLSVLTPDMRFGQLIANLAFLAAGPWEQTLWDLEDASLLGAIRQLEADLSQRVDEANPCRSAFPG